MQQFHIQQLIQHFSLLFFAALLTLHSEAVLIIYADICVFEKLSFGSGIQPFFSEFDTHLQFWLLNLDFGSIKEALFVRKYYVVIDWVIGPKSLFSPCNGIFLPLSCDFLRLMKVKVAQLCLTLCDPMDYTVHGILYARILAWAPFPFSRGSSQPRDWIQVSCIAGRFFTSWATREA